MRAPRPHRYGRAKHRGAALMIMIVILVAGVATVLVGALSASALQNARQERTSAALMQARDALLGYAVSDDTRPGELPCPDINGDGMLTMGVDYGGGGACVQYVGRLPWKTLGLSEQRDGDNETLWYALSTDFRAGNTVVLNSNTKGTLLVYSADGVTLQTEAGYSAVAIVFSPGSVIGSQVRSTTAEKNSAANYLDTANSRNNATAAGPFIAGAKSETFNDQLLFITTKDLMPLVEQRVAGEVKKALTDYFAANGYYPWADVITSTGNYESDAGQNRGWLPDNATTGGGYMTPNWAAGSPPQWFLDNQWFTLIYYSVAKDRTVNSSICSTCIDNTLSVDGTNGVQALFLMPGTYSGTRAIDNLSQYLEDSQNNDYANDLYVTPTSQAKDRDRLYRLP